MNYVKYPSTKTKGKIIQGWEAILEEIKTGIGAGNRLVVECYQGVNLIDIKNVLTAIQPEILIDSYTLLKSETELSGMLSSCLTDDVLFGHKGRFKMVDFFDTEKLEQARKSVADNDGVVIVFGYGASLVISDPDLMVFADMARWEIQQRFRRKEACLLGTKMKDELTSVQYKRGYFIEWGVFDDHKRGLYEKVSYWLDTHVPEKPKMIDKETFYRGLENTVSGPFRVVPFFDPAPWGGQWMKDVCGLDAEKINYGWCFDCVPEENSLYLEVEGVTFEMPSINLVFLQSAKLLGTRVEARFGKEFPIRFDLLDTLGGGNLSLQVHPTTEYVRKNFGICYTQDESYYIIDAKEDGCVYLGLKEETNPEEMVADLQRAEKGEIIFDADKYVNKLPARKHDHFLIPGGTIHCSCTNTLVLEISSTPNIFTFKLWDWNRLGLDGKPRPINVSRGLDVIDWNRKFDYTKKQLWNAVTPIAEGDGYITERTGLHENEFIESHRCKFTQKVLHKTYGSVNVLNLVDGEEAVIESPTNKFAPFVVHYAETFIIPAWVGEYTIAPYGESQGKECITIKAFVRS